MKPQNRFSDEFKNVLLLSRDVTNKFKSQSIEPEHILLASLLVKPELDCSKSMLEYGITKEIIIDHLEKLVERTPKRNFEQVESIPLSKNSEKILKQMVIESNLLNDFTITTSHFFLATLKHSDLELSKLLESFNISYPNFLNSYTKSKTSQTANRGKFIKSENSNFIDKLFTFLFNGWTRQLFFYSVILLGSFEIFYAFIGPLISSYRKNNFSFFVTLFVIVIVVLILFYISLRLIKVLKSKPNFDKIEKFHFMQLAKIFLLVYAIMVLVVGNVQFFENIMFKLTLLDSSYTFVKIPSFELFLILGMKFLCFLILTIYYINRQIE
ncbi:hypothetical protein SAMN06298216_1974 [Spirosomataceae bacterium TFI 002]|nr:hypothetical protein SAMN06298216_1974 [Spirosomataceae bacterium TFI 002]